MRYLVIALLFSQFTVQGQKNVLFEKFTNAYCGVCPDATITINNVVEEHPNVIWISHHKPVTWTDNPLTNEKSIAIWDALNVNGVPNGMVDRTVYNNSIFMSRHLWKSRIEDHLNDVNNVEIDFELINYDNSTRNLEFSITVTPLTNDLVGPFRLTSFIVEDTVYGVEQHSYWNDVEGHPLQGEGDIIWSYPHRNVVRTILEDHWGVNEVLPNNPTVGTSYSRNFTYEIPWDFKADRIKIVSMISSFDESNSYPGVVHNAVQQRLNELGLNLSSDKTTEIVDFKMSPNPANDLVEIRFTEPINDLQILDSNSRLVWKSTRTNDYVQINTSDFPNGIYSVIFKAQGQYYGRQLVITH